MFRAECFTGPRCAWEHPPSTVKLLRMNMAKLDLIVTRWWRSCENTRKETGGGGGGAGFPRTKSRLTTAFERIVVSGGQE